MNKTLFCSFSYVVRFLCALLIFSPPSHKGKQPLAWLHSDLPSIRDRAFHLFSLVYVPRAFGPVYILSISCFVGAFVLDTGASIWILNDIGIYRFPFFTFWAIPVFLWSAFDFIYKKPTPTFSDLQREALHIPLRVCLLFGV